MRLLTAALLLMSASPALAATDVWTAEMQMDEGGEVMVAYIDGEGTAGDVPQPTLRLQCFDVMILRYEVGIIPDDAYPAEGSEAELLFRTDKGEARLPVVMEAMDMMFAAYFEKDDPSVGLLREGTTLEVSAPDLADYPVRTFTLNGAAAAIDTLLATCP